MEVASSHPELENKVLLKEMESGNLAEILNLSSLKFYMTKFKVTSISLSAGPPMSDTLFF